VDDGLAMKQVVGNEHMSGIIKATIVTFVIMFLIAAGLSAMAAMPAYTGLKCPPAVDGKTGAVTGRVTASTGTAGLVGAYIAVVNASNVSEEYFNTTSGADGYYQIVGINASYNATNASDVGPNGPTPYMIYANMSPYGEGYSAAFGIDASGGPASPATGVSPIAVASSTPTPEPSPTLSPTPAPTATPEPTAVPATATAPVPTATPQPTPGLISPILPLLIAAFVAIGLSGRKKK
jgi:hypothetical protein